MKCPVCPVSDIPDDSEVCPVCSTNLVPWQRVRNLHVAEYNEAVRLANAGAVDLALRHALAAVALDDRFVPAMILAGRIFWQKGQFADALARWQEAAQLAPENQELPELLAHGRHCLRRRKINHVLSLIAVTAAVALLAIVPPLTAMYDANQKTGALGARLASLERSLARREVPAGPATTDSSASPPTTKPARETDPVADVNRRLDGALARLQDLAGERAAEASKLGAYREQVQSMTGTLASLQQDLVQEHAAMATLSARTTATLQGRIDSVQREFNQNLLKTTTLITRSTASSQDGLDALRRDLNLQRSMMLTLIPWTRTTVRAMVDSLRPGRLDSLAQEISREEQALQRLQEQGELLRNSRNPFNAVKYRSVRTKIQESENRLATLRAEWRDKMEPWLRARDSAELSLKALDSLKLGPLAERNTPQRGQ